MWEVAKQRKRQIKQFNRASLTYDHHAELYRKIAYRLLIQIDCSQWQPARILDLGCGTGYLTHLLLDRFPHAKIIAVDIAEKMVQTARENLDGQTRVEWLVADAESMDFRSWGGFDLIILNAVCHWFQCPQATFARVAEALNVGGRLLVSTYGPDMCYELAAIFRQVEEEWELPTERHLLPFYAVKTWENLFTDIGLTPIQSRESWVRSEYDNCRALLESIKAVGEAYSEANSPLILQTRLLQEVMRRYDRAYRSGKGIYATAHFLQMHLKKTGDSAHVMLFK